MHFRDRVQAGQRLAGLVRHLQPDRPLVIGVPGGGVPVGLEVAAALEAPFEVWLAAKLGAGAIAEGDVGFLPQRLPDAQVGRTQLELQARAARLRAGRPPPEIRRRTVVVVDDGVATGATLHAVLQALRSRQPRSLVVAVPIGPRGRLAELRRVADQVHALEEPPQLAAIGAWYHDFAPVPERLVRSALARPGAQLEHATEALPANTRAIEVHTGDVALAGTLSAPREAPGVVILSTASACGRFDARRRFLASELRKHGLATLLFDLLTPDEERRALVAGEFRFDFELLGHRLLAATHWIAHHPDTLRMRIGCLDGPIGPGVALDAAARRPQRVQAVASMGASPHVARKYLGRSRAPTLWLVGERDASVLHLDPREIAELFGEADLEIVGGAGSLFEEPFALEQVGALAGRWFARQLIDPGLPAVETLLSRPAVSAGADPAT